MSTATAVEQHPLAVEQLPLTDAEIKARFEALLPELASRADAIAKSAARRKDDREELAAEVVAMCWANYRQAALKGRWLPAGMMAWFAWQAVRSGRTLAGQSSQNDVMDPRAEWAGHARIIPLGPLMRGRRYRDAVRGRKADTGDLADTERLVRALTTSERESPLDLARQRIDWTVFAEGQDRRTRTILAGLAEGRKGKEIARRIGVSQGRLCQVMDETVRREVAAYYSLDPISGTDIC